MNRPTPPGLDLLSTSAAYPWSPDCGDGTYRNPILYADYSDPDAVRVDADFFMVASSFNCTPGLPVLHSKDLVNWTLVNHALRNLPDPRYAAVQHGCGVWAPAIRHHAGKFWIFFPTPDEGIYVITATDPHSTWSEPHMVARGKGLIDPCPLWDDDGTAWLVHAYAGSRAGIKHRLRVVPMAPDGSKLLGEGQIVYHDPERQPTLEGPKFLKRNGWYYILAPAGGVTSGWQLALRSRNILGPYEAKTVLAQGDTPVNGPHQGALVDLPDNGGWWFLHFQDVGLYGRVVHLQPVTWQDDWPLMGAQEKGQESGVPVLRHAKPPVRFSGRPAIPATSDEFDAPRLGLQWQWNANHETGWHQLDPARSRLRLNARPFPGTGLQDAPSLLLQKFPARSFTVDTDVELRPDRKTAEAGLTIMGEKHGALAVRHEAGRLELILRSNDGVTSIGPVSAGTPVKLRVEVRDGGACRFSHCTGGEWIPVPGELQAVAGKWIGARVGLYCLDEAGGNAFAEFDAFRFS